MDVFKLVLGPALIVTLFSQSFAWAQASSCKSLFSAANSQTKSINRSSQLPDESTQIAELAQLMDRINSINGEILPADLKEMQDQLAVLNEDDWKMVYTLAKPDQMEQVLNAIYETPQKAAPANFTKESLPAIAVEELNAASESETSTDFPGLDKIEKELGRALMGQESETQITRGGGFAGFMRRVFRHPLFPYRTLLEYNNQVRERLTYSQVIEKTIEEVLQKENPDLDEKLKERLEAVYRALDETREIVAQEILSVYGYNALDSSTPVPAQFNVYDVAVKINRGGLIQTARSHGDYIEKAAQIVRELNDILNIARTRKGQPERGPKDWSATELKVMNRAMQREVVSHERHYQDLLSHGSSADLIVRYRYYIQDRDYKRERPRRKPNYPLPAHHQGRFEMYGAETVDLTYYEVLINRVGGYQVGTTYTPKIPPDIPFGFSLDSPYTIVDVPDRERVRRDSAEAAQQEDIANNIISISDKAVVDLISRHSEYFDQVKGDPRLKNERLKEIDQLASLAVNLEERISEFLESDPVWRDDSEYHRKRRLGALLEDARATILLLSIYREQVERDEKNPYVVTMVLDHSQTLNAIRGRFQRFVWGHVGGWTFAVAAGCLGANYLGLECLPGMWENILPFIRLPER